MQCHLAEATVECMWPQMLSLNLDRFCMRPTPTCWCYTRPCREDSCLQSHAVHSRLAMSDLGRRIVQLASGLPVKPDAINFCLR